jgi:uncharacterized protein YndB with AHSA1/START domain
MDIVHVVEIQTTPERLYEAVTTQKGLAGWWTRDTKAEPRVGAVNGFGFSGKMSFRLKVEKLEPGKRVVWSSVQGPPDWTGTEIAFDIAPSPAGATLRFTHAGFASTGGGFGVYSYSWAQFLRSLRLLLETGRGEPAGA